MNAEGGLGQIFMPYIPSMGAAFWYTAISEYDSIDILKFTRKS